MCPRIDAAEATKLVREHLKIFSQFKPVSAKLIGNTWCIKVNLGLFKTKLVEIEVNAETGKVLKGRLDFFLS